MPQRFVSSTRSYSSRSVSTTDLSRPTPALLQRTSTRPKRSTVALDEPLGMALVADVGGDERELEPSAASDSRELLALAGGPLRCDDRGALGREPLDDRAADAAAAPVTIATFPRKLRQCPLVISDDMIGERLTSQRWRHVPPSPDHSWRGVYPAICTPFTAEDAVDLEAQRRVVRFALDGGAHGIVAFGLAGEVLKLSADERRELTDVIVDEVGGAVPVFVGAGAPSVRASIELARHAEQAGASCVVLPAPMAVGRGEARSSTTSSRIAAAVSLPVMIQDAPAYLGVGLGPALVQRIADAADNVRLVKLEAGPAEMSDWIERARGRVRDLGR